jgi:cytochrome oxidase assembly protein ShyY1
VDSNEYMHQQLSELDKIRRWNNSQTRTVVDALRDSGMSIAAFANFHGLGYWRVMNAKRRIDAKNRRRSSKHNEPALVPVTIATDAPTASTGWQRWVLEVELSGCFVRLSPNASEQVVAATLRAIKAIG